MKERYALRIQMVKLNADGSPPPADTPGVICTYHSAFSTTDHDELFKIADGMSHLQDGAMEMGINSDDLEVFNPDEEPDHDDSWLDEE